MRNSANHLVHRDTIPRGTMRVIKNKWKRLIVQTSTQQSGHCMVASRVTAVAMSGEGGDDVESTRTKPFGYQCNATTS